jgi:hypothetical protein
MRETAMTQYARTLAVIAVIAATTWSCADVPPYAPHAMIRDPAQLYMTLTLNHEAVNLSTAAPYDTVTLIATPRNALGQPMDGLGQATFTSLDTNTVTVTADGKLQARAPGNDVRVIAELRGGENVRQVDTAWVSVTDNPTPPHLATFSIHPVPPDSAVWFAEPFMAQLPAAFMQVFAGIPMFPQISLRALDSAGNQLPLSVKYTLSDSVLLPYFDTRTGYVGNIPETSGQAQVTVTTYAYGETRADTLTVTIKPPLVQAVVLHGFNPDGSLSFMPTEVRIVPEGYVFFVNFSVTDSLGVTFDDPSKADVAPPMCNALGLCDSGDIAPFGAADFGAFTGWLRARQFHESGTYSYHVGTRMSGRINVTP